MKILIAFILSCASVFGAETGIQLFTTTETNAATASIYTTDVFTRDGQTNLVRETTTQAGVIQLQFQTFYHDGTRLATFCVNPAFSQFYNEPGARYSVCMNLNPSNEVQDVTIGTYGTNRLTVDAFICTNGYFYPIEDSEIKKINAMPKKMWMETPNPEPYWARSLTPR